MKIDTKLIEKYMVANSLSKNKFCNVCGISVCTLKKILLNDFNFGISALFKIAKVIKMEVYQMFKE